ncbi:MAG TPA: IspD/TarI family cytidylyltransferase [Streptosporangiaceae bacterium]|nr:IspD/TarI family cytidylyltransferase [Streptosporangiaceae bacterium]
MRTVAVVLAGGTGQRFGGELPKQLHELAGRTLVEHSVAAFDQAPGVDSILVVMPAGLPAPARERFLAAAGYPKVTRVIEGGVTRTDSTRCAIAALSPAEAVDTQARTQDQAQAGAQARDQAAQAHDDGDTNVLFHDAARPLLDQRIIADCVAALATDQAIGVAVPSSDTIVEVSDGLVTGMPRRDALARCQTPQGFRLSVIRQAYRLADADPDFGQRPATDDCGIVHRYLPAVPVRLVRGSERNIKITYPGDLDVAEALLRRG